MDWLVIDAATDNIIGYNRGGSTIPPNTPARLYVEATAGMIDQYNTHKNDIRSTQRTELVKYQAGAFVVPTDRRQTYRIETSSSSVALGSSVTLTISLLNSDLTLNPVTTSGIFKTSSGKKWKLDFIDGVATKLLTPQRSGDFNVSSSGDYVINPTFNLEVYE